MIACGTRNYNRRCGMIPVCRTLSDALVRVDPLAGRAVRVWRRESGDEHFTGCDHCVRTWAWIPFVRGKYWAKLLQCAFFLVFLNQVLQFFFVAAVGTN